MLRPELTQQAAADLSVNNTEKAYLLAVRGFNKSKNKSQKNEINIYDDAIFLITPEEVTGFNFNTDPSKEKPGMAVMQPGVYKYKKGLHGLHHLDLNNGHDKWLYQELIHTGRDLKPEPDRIFPYWALRQAGPITVLRDGSKTPETKVDQRDWPWINIHRGGVNTTSSEGCQTVHPEQWQEFRNKVYKALADYQLQEINYILSLAPTS